MDSLERACVTLLIRGDELIPSEISALFKVKPELGVRKDGKFLGGDGHERIARTGMWYFGRPWRTPPNLNEQIVELLGALPDDAEIWADVTTRFDCLLAIGAYLDGWTGGLGLKQTTLRLLADRGLPLDVDLYAPAASD